MKITFKIEKDNIRRIVVAFIFAMVLFFNSDCSLYAVIGFGILYFGIKNLEITIKEKWNWLWTVLILWGSSVFTTYLIQYLLLDAELRAKTSNEKLWLNVLCCLVVYLLTQVITNNTGLSCIISHITLISFGGVNYFVYLFRGNEFIFSDIRSIQTGLSVAGNYEFALDDRAAYVILISALYVALIRKLHITFERKKVWMRVICVSLGILCCVYVGNATENTMTETWEQKGSYRNGFVLNFVLSIRDYFVAEPEGYSPEVIAELEAEYVEGKSADSEDESFTTESDRIDQGEKPTIIVIMSESYAKLGVVGNFRTNEEVTPYFDSLTENTIRGYALSSVFGAKTPNSEWEFMTGNSMAFLPGGSVVYQQYISEEPNSLVSDLKNLGYTCVAMHPYYATGWSRNMVYPDMGFDEMHFIEDFDQTKIMRKYVTDQEFYEKIIERYESKASNEDLFIMSISMQNHGGYTENYDNFTGDIRLLGMDYPDVDQYLSLLHESDAALEYLIHYFENVEEPVEIVFFLCTL